ncbi:MAG TPA: hypothetical protein VFZ66_21195 [Herpetosiphonaceae bacterium]
METNDMKVHACPTCGSALELDGSGYRCEEHGLWYTYGGNLLVHAPSDEHKTRDRFTMPWEALPHAS